MPLGVRRGCFAILVGEICVDSITCMNFAFGCVSSLDCDWVAMKCLPFMLSEFLVVS